MHRSLVLVLVTASMLLAPSVAAQAWQGSDGVDDVYFTAGWNGPATEPTGQSPTYLTYIDVRSLTIVASDTSIAFSVENRAGFNAASTDPFPADRTITHTVHFTLPGTGKRASVDLKSGMPPTSPADESFYPVRAQFCVLASDDQSDCGQGGTNLAFSVGQGQATIVLPITTLAEASAPTDAPALGNILLFGFHDASEQPPCCGFDVGWIDRMPDTGNGASFLLSGASAPVANQTEEPEKSSGTPGVASEIVMLVLVAVVALRRRD